MHFCPKCGNMYYLQLKKDDEDKLIYYCRNCGNEDESLVTNLNNLYVSKTDIKKEMNYKNSINQSPWTPKQVYHYIQWFDIKPDLLIDISDFQEKKMKAIMAYESQFYNPKSTEPNTPISSKRFIVNFENYVNVLKSSSEYFWVVRHQRDSSYPLAP